MRKKFVVLARYRVSRASAGKYIYLVEGRQHGVQLAVPQFELSRVGPPMELAIASLPGALQGAGGPQVVAELADEAADQPAEIGRTQDLQPQANVAEAAADGEAPHTAQQ